jgi:hypothetical protein
VNRVFSIFNCLIFDSSVEGGMPSVAALTRYGDCGESHPALLQLPDVTFLTRLCQRTQVRDVDFRARLDCNDAVTGGEVTAG